MILQMHPASVNGIVVPDSGYADTKMSTPTSSPCGKSRNPRHCKIRYQQTAKQILVEGLQDQCSKQMILRQLDTESVCIEAIGLMHRTYKMIFSRDARSQPKSQQLVMTSNMKRQPSVTIISAQQMHV